MPQLPGEMLAQLLGGAGAGGPPPGMPGMPPGIAAGGPGPFDSPPPDDPPDELSALQDAIQDIHKLIAVVRGPQDTADVNQALGILLKVQTRMMAGQQTGPMQQRLTG